jgi:uncharacterized lipoprotein YehR (DUF1307 family)
MKKTVSLILAILFCIALCGCNSAQSNVSKNPAPFSTLTWKSTEQDMETAYGKWADVNKNDDKSTSYTYPTTYEGVSGKTSYTFNEDGTLRCITFYSSLKSESELKNIFDVSNEYLKSEYGEYSDSTKNAINDKSYINFYDWNTSNGEISLVEECMSVSSSTSYSFTFRCVTPNESDSSSTSTNDVTIEETASQVEATEITTGKTVTINDVCAFSLDSFSVTKTVNPPHPNSYYYYFEAPDNSVFVDVKMTIKNLASSAVRMDEVVDGVKVIYDDKYEYNCQFVTESDNGGNLEQFTSLYSVNPLVTLKYHMIAELPSSATNDGKSLEAVVTADGQEFHCTLR